MTEFALGTTQGGYNVWKANYDYGELQTNGTVDATKNSGNIGKQTVTFSGLANPFVQGYKYDSLDRITEAKETVNGTQTWIQNWGYDRYGNRSSFSQNIFGYTSVSNPTVSSTTNRFTSGGFTFDKNGNVTFDHNGYEFTYDGNNKQTQAILSTQKGGVVTLGTYYYDGEGKRVKKTTHTSDNVIFVYANGKLVEERNASTNALQTSYVYAGSQLLSTETASATNYTVTDNLGSPRVIVNGSGTTVARRDFLPFGEELFADGTYRKSSDNYGTSGSDAVRQRFTGYQKDTETGLDFAEARMYQNQHGRFTAVDPLLASGKSANPQTFNRYVYTTNRPLTFTDSTGLQMGTSPGGWFKPAKPDENGLYHPTFLEKGATVPDGWQPAPSQYWNYQSKRMEYLSLPGPDPIGNPWGYELSKVNDAISAGGKQFTDLVYAVAPDYCRAQISAPVMPQFQLDVSKDLNVFFGGGVTNSIFDGKGLIEGASKFNFLNGAKSIGFKFQASVTCGYFLTSSMDPGERDRAIEGTNVSVAGNLPFAPMINGGLSKSLPLFGGPPASVEAGIGPNTGVGVSSSDKIFSFNEWLKKNKQAQN